MSTALQTCWQGQTNGKLTLHLPLFVNDDTCVVLEVQEDAVFPAESFALADDHARHDCGQQQQHSRTHTPQQGSESGLVGKRRWHEQVNSV